ncbi:MAG: S8 family serine peptidase [Planctomycetes bacterium]|nr:S8 family serine peptidase [Planctomycetota bacterium]
MSLLALGLAALAAQTPASPSSHAAAPVSGRAALAQGVIESPAAPSGADGTVVVPPHIALSLATPATYLADLPDVAPRPTAARVASSNAGDAVLEPAAGDPYFLGFAAGNYYPPTGERLDPELLASIRVDAFDGRPEPIVYAFAMFEHRITAARTAALEALGVRVLGYHPSNCLKLAIPLAAFEAVAASPELHWLGTPKRWQKLHPSLGAHTASAGDLDVRLVVDVYDSDLNAASFDETVGSASQLDAGTVRLAPAGTQALTRTRSNGWQERALADLGVQVDEYEDAIRAFHVRAPASRIDALAASDFVQFVEPDFEKGAFHDESTPMIYSDSVRYYANGGTSSSVIAGIVDSGFDSAHSDLNHTWGVGWELGGSGGAWNDVCEHGSHVAGTILGNGAMTASLRGNAPGLGWGGAGRFYAVKVSNACSGWSGSVSTWMAPFHTAYFDGVSTTPVPHVINNSWGSSVFNAAGAYVGPYFGTESEARLLDSEVYNRGQLHVFAAGNDGSGASTIGLQAAAKNVFAVGSVRKQWTSTTLPGELSSFSSRGPTGDSRWKPNIVAPGESVDSVDANSGNGYTFKQGTSMAAPHVTGVFAQMLDHLSFLKYAPERAHSVVMATAMTKANQTLNFASDAHLRTYGAGKIEAWKANYGTSQMGWSNWGSYLGANSYTYADFTVGAGCTRLVVCMNYSDPQCSAGASQALVNNFDMYLDASPIDPNFNTGDYFAQLSTVDNTEIRILDNPVTGTWRWKIWPTNAPQGVFYGLTVYAQYGDITPDVSVTVTPGKTYLKPNENTPFTVNTYAPTYLASNVVIDADCHFGNGYVSLASKYLGDGAYSSITTGGNLIQYLMGDILHGNSRSADFLTSFAQEGQWGFVAKVRGDNISTVSSMGVVTVDGTPPSAVDPLVCTDHSVDTWSNVPFFVFDWANASDSFSGLAGYSFSTSFDAPADPGVAIDTTSSAYLENLGSGAQGRFFNVRAVDRCGNGGATSSIGPFYVDTDAPFALQNLAADVPIDGTTCGPITLWWDDGYDATSGLAGYSVFIDNDPFATPTGSLDATTTSYTTTLPPSGLPYYIHVSGVDYAGNVGVEANWGPVYVGPMTVTNFCKAKLSSGGCTPTISANGCPSYGSGDVHITATNVPGETTGRLLWGLHTNPYALGSGISMWGRSPKGNKLCVAQPTWTGVQFSGGTAGACDGVLDFAMDAAFFAANGLTPGTDVYAQYLLDDPSAADGSKLGHTDALRFTIAP